MWVKRPIEPEDKWKRGRVCEMTRSLNIGETDELVWNAVLDALGKSSLMKETVRKEVTGDSGQKLVVNAKEAKARDGKIKTLQKLIAKLEDSLMELESDRLMGKVSIAQYPKIKAIITEEKVNSEAEVEKIQRLIADAQQQKSWIDWVGKFQKKVDEYRTFTPEQKKELLQGLLTSVDVHLIDSQTHWLEINFKIPLVADHVVYRDPAKKSLGYTVKEGQTALMVEFVSRPYSKKKPLPPMA